MKKILIAGLVASSMYAQSLSVIVAGISTNDKIGDYQSHNVRGLKYDYEYTNDFSIGAEVSRLKHFYKDYQLFTVNATWLPINYNGFKAGVNIASGYQNEKCNYTMCKENSKSVLVPSVQLQYDISNYAIGTNVSMEQERLFAKFFVTLVKW